MPNVPHDGNSSGSRESRSVQLPVGLLDMSACVVGGFSARFILRAGEILPKFPQGESTSQCRACRRHVLRVCATESLAYLGHVG